MIIFNMLRKLYKQIRKNLSTSQKAKLSRLIFALSSKPFVRKDNIPSSEKFPGRARGGMIISADFELAWAWRYARQYDDPYKISLKMAERARRNFPFLIKLFESYNIPITWATVGHLFLESCNQEDHDWMSRIPYFENRNWKYDQGDWFDCDPYTNVNQDNHWYAPDLIESIQSSAVNHEIATHTFTHIDFSDKNCPTEVANDEIKASREAMSRFNVSPVSIVFPGGTWGNVNILKKYDIKIYRKNVDFELAYPYYDRSGLLITPSSAGFGRLHNWSIKYYIKRYITYIDKALETGTICHFWFHPSLDNWFLRKIFPEILNYANNKREEGALWIGTMANIANYINHIKE